MVLKEVDMSEEMEEGEANEGGEDADPSRSFSASLVSFKEEESFSLSLSLKCLLWTFST